MAANDNGPPVSRDIYEGATKRGIQLLRIGRNAENVPAAFSLDLGLMESALDLEFVGEALETTTSISHLSVYFRDIRHIPTESWKGVLQFVESNLHLKVLYISHEDERGLHGEALSLLRAAAARSSSIEKLSFVDYTEETEAKMKFVTAGQPGFSSSVKELVLSDIRGEQDIAAAWPENHSIQTLKLDGVLGDGKVSEDSSTENMIDSVCGYSGYLSALWKKLAENPNSTKISHLFIDVFEIEAMWSPGLPLFLSSPNSSLQRLDLACLDFGHPIRGSALNLNRSRGGTPIYYTQMDALLHGLDGSPTTTALNFQYCIFNDLSMGKLLTFLKFGSSIKHLGFMGVDSEVDFATGFLTCDGLESLAIKEEDEDCPLDANIDAAKNRLENCSLDSLHFSTERLQSLGSSLTIAMTRNNLTTLGLEHSWLKDEDLDCLVGFLENGDCQLLNLSINYWKGDAEARGKVAPKILQALAGGGKRTLQSLTLQHGEESILSGVLRALCENLGKIKTLTSLELVLSDNYSSQTETSLAAAFVENWSLERVLLAKEQGDAFRDSCTDRYLQPITTTGFKSKVDRLALRNKAKKLIATTMQEDAKEQLMHKLESFWGLPDELTLAFWLLQRMPGTFFTQQRLRPKLGLAGRQAKRGRMAPTKRKRDDEEAKRKGKTPGAHKRCRDQYPGTTPKPAKSQTTVDGSEPPPKPKAHNVAEQEIVDLVSDDDEADPPAENVGVARANQRRSDKEQPYMEKRSSGRRLPPHMARFMRNIERAKPWTCNCDGPSSRLPGHRIRCLWQSKCIPTDGE